jgi:hypothetical protein
MNEERTPSDVSQEPSTNPSEQAPQISSPSSPGLKIGIVVLALAAGLTGIYGWMQQRAARDLAFSRDEMSASLQQARSQEAALSAKLNALSTAQATEEAARREMGAEKQEAVPRTAETPRHSLRHVVTHRARSEDPRWKQIQEQLGEQEQELNENKQQIAATQTNLEQARSELDSNLQSTKSELGGDIARNHNELVAMQKKGERNYYEFDIPKSKAYHHTGPISISLRKANNKHQYCDLDMLINDTALTRKHVNLYESISFYPEGYPLPMEVVINHIGKDSVHGYVSAPKYRANTAQAQAVAPTAASPTTASVDPSAAATPDTKLEHRPDDVH